MTATQERHRLESETWPPSGVCDCSVATRTRLCKHQVPAHTYLAGRQDADEERAAWDSRLKVKVGVLQVGNALFDVWHAASKSHLVSPDSQQTILQPDKVKIKLFFLLSSLGWGVGRGVKRSIQVYIHHAHQCIRTTCFYCCTPSSVCFNVLGKAHMHSTLSLTFPKPFLWNS